MKIKLIGQGLNSQMALQIGPRSLLVNPRQLDDLGTKPDWIMILENEILNQFQDSEFDLIGVKDGKNEEIFPYVSWVEPEIGFKIKSESIRPIPLKAEGIFGLKFDSGIYLPAGTYNLSQSQWKSGCRTLVAEVDSFEHTSCLFDEIMDWPDLDRLILLRYLPSEEEKSIIEEAAAELGLNLFLFTGVEALSMRTIFPSPGGKTYMSSQLIKMLPKHETYCEPFAGASALYFRRNPEDSKLEILNDLDSEIAFAYQFIKKMTNSQFGRLKRFDWRVFPGKFEKVKNSKVPIDPVKRFYRFIYLQWGSFYANRKSPRTSKFINDGGKLVWRGIHRLHDLKERLKNTIITCSDYKQVVSKWDREGTFFFLDPPYYRDWYKEEEKINPEEFKTVINGIKHAKFLITLENSAKMKGLFSNYHQRIVRVSRGIGGRGGPKDTELIVTNYDTRGLEAKLSKHRRDRCMDCSKPPVYEILWAEGMAHAWFCREHFGEFLNQHIEKCKKGGFGLDIDYVKEVRDGIANKKFQDNPNSSIKGQSNFKKLIQERMFKIEDYDPRKSNDRQLANDWMTLCAKYFSEKSDEQTTEFKSAEAVIDFGIILLSEIIHRNKIIFHPENMKPASREFLFKCLERINPKVLRLEGIRAQRIWPGASHTLLDFKPDPEFYYLVAAEKGWGFIRFAIESAHKINEDEALKRLNELQLSEDTISSLFEDYDEMYLVRIKEFLGENEPRDLAREEEKVDSMPQKLDKLDENDLASLHDQLHEQYKNDSSNEIAEIHAAVVAEMGNREIEHLPEDDLDREFEDNQETSELSDEDWEYLDDLLLYRDLADEPRWRKTAEYFRYRVRGPQLFQKESFRIVPLKKAKPRITSIQGWLKGEKTMTMQAVLFPKEDDWTLAKAKVWIKGHPDIKKHSSDAVMFLGSESEEPVEDWLYLIHHLHKDKGRTEEVHHCRMVDHLGNLYEIEHVPDKKDKVQHCLTGLVSDQKVFWNENEAKDDGKKIPCADRQL